MLGTFTLLLAALPPFEASDAISHNAQVRALAATVRVHDKGGTGTGTIVGKQGRSVYILTAYHCIEDHGVQVELFTAESYPNPILCLSSDITVVARSKAHDLALLRVITNERLPPPISICPPSLAPQGKFDVITVGCSGGGAPRVWLAKTLGTTRATNLQGDPWLIDMDSVPGRSGGALIDDRGLLIGVCCRRVPDGSGGCRGVYSGPNEIHALCDEAGLPWLYRDTRDTHLPISAFVLLFVKIVLAEVLMTLFARKADVIPPGDPSAGASIDAVQARWNLLFFLIFSTLLLLGWTELVADYGVPVGMTAGLLLGQYLGATWIGRPAGYGPKHPLVWLIPCQSVLFLLIPTPTWHPQVFAAAYVFLGFAIRVMAIPAGARQEAAQPGAVGAGIVRKGEENTAQPATLSKERDTPVCIP